MRARVTWDGFRFSYMPSKLESIAERLRMRAYDSEVHFGHPHAARFFDWLADIVCKIS